MGFLAKIYHDISIDLFVQGILRFVFLFHMSKNFHMSSNCALTFLFTNKNIENVKMNFYG